MQTELKKFNNNLVLHRQEFNYGILMLKWVKQLVSFHIFILSYNTTDCSDFLLHFTTNRDLVCFEMVTLSITWRLRCNYTHSWVDFGTLIRELILDACFVEFPRFRLLMKQISSIKQLRLKSAKTQKERNSVPVNLHCSDPGNRQTLAIVFYKGITKPITHYRPKNWWSSVYRN